MIKKSLYFLVYSLAIYACSPTTTTSTSSIETYNEDLSVHRPKFDALDESKEVKSSTKEVEISYPEPTNDVTKNLNAVLDSINRLKANIKYVDGFTVQVYSGTSSEEAKIARGKVYSILSDASPSLKYDEPNFKVKVGKYYSRLEAQKTYAQLKRKFPNSIIIPEKIYLEEID
ncbi:MAG: SPOR domain-containing protein [Fulvivirga sp.]|uniref:SPOR domain-containing protein n=1 Tax=Fulvivirga sp. TaxID=1931237 RepID=UPI0032ED6535